MSFAAKVKEEIITSDIITARHCKMAALLGVLLCGSVTYNESTVTLISENIMVIGFAKQLIEELLDNCNDLEIKKSTHSVRLILSGKNKQELFEILKLERIHSIDLSRNCCKRAFLMGSFVVAGSLSNPDKAYHLEIAGQAEYTAGLLRDIFLSFEISSKILKRKNSYVVYIKNSESISDALLVLNASNALITFTNVKIKKDFTNDINRRVNFESSNICKAANAASEQIKDIELIINRVGLGYLSSNLQEVAELRLNNKEVSIQELSDISGHLSKSCINHRLRKIRQIARTLT